jgi:hypothetical protein
MKPDFAHAEEMRSRRGVEVLHREREALCEDVTLGVRGESAHELTVRARGAKRIRGTVFTKHKSEMEKETFTFAPALTQRLEEFEAFGDRGALIDGKRPCVEETFGAQLIRIIAQTNEDARCTLGQVEEEVPIVFVGIRDEREEFALGQMIESQDTRARDDCRENVGERGCCEKEHAPGRRFLENFEKCVGCGVLHAFDIANAATGIAPDSRLVEALLENADIVNTDRVGTRARLRTMLLRYVR